MSIKIGIGTALGGSALSPADYWRWVELCETGGIDSIWHSDQLLGEQLEPMTMLAALAARTSRIRFGTNALVVPFRDPIVTAKKFAAIDYLSGGRLFPVLGVGRADDAYWTATGTGAGERGRRANEAIALIRLLLGQDEIDFAGSHYRYHGPGVLPRPARPIPLWIGGQSEAAIRRTATIGDGWLGSFAAPDKAGEAKRRIQAGLAETGRTIEEDHYGMSLPMRIGDAGDPAVAAVRERLAKRLPPEERTAFADSFAAGPTDDVIALLRRYVAAGMSKFVMLPLVGDAAGLMEQTRLLLSHVIPAIEDRPPAGE